MRKLRREINNLPKFTLVSGRAGTCFHCLDYLAKLLLKPGARYRWAGRSSQNDIIIDAHTWSRVALGRKWWSIQKGGARKAYGEEVTCNWVLRSKLEFPLWEEWEGKYSRWQHFKAGKYETAWCSGRSTTWLEFLENFWKQRRQMRLERLVTEVSIPPIGSWDLILKVVGNMEAF